MTEPSRAVSSRRGVGGFLSDPWKRLSQGVRRHLATNRAAVPGPVGFRVKP
jgi:hypothetical protein